jgi:class 3 adenylate cyclase
MEAENTAPRPESLAEKLERKREMEKEQFTMMTDLYGHYRNGTFLSIDIVGSTRLKEGEDSLKVMQAFQAFHRFISENIYGSLGSVFSGDGVMCLFGEAPEAVNAALRILKGLEKFNKEESQLKKYLNVRVGINSGTILADVVKDLGKVTERNIDIAGHLQKFARPGEMLISAFTWELIADQDDFIKQWKTIDNVVVYRYKYNTTPLAEQPYWNRASRSIETMIEEKIAPRWDRIRKYFNLRYIICILVTVVTFAILVIFYLQWDRKSNNGPSGEKSALIENNRVRGMGPDLRLGHARIRSEGRWTDLPNSIYLVIPKGTNTSANEKNGIRENKVITLHRDTSGYFAAVSLGFFSKELEVRNGYLIFLTREEAERYLSN